MLRIERTVTDRIWTENISVHLSVAKFVTEEEIEQVLRQVKLFAKEQTAERIFEMSKELELV